MARQNNLKLEKTNTDEPESIDVSAPQEALCNAISQRLLFMAGAGSGKTHVMGLISADFIINHPHVCGFIGANTYGQLSKATLKRIFTVWKDVFGWTNGVDYIVDRKPPKSWIKFDVELKDYKNTISFDNGCLILLGSLDNYKAIDGTEFAWALLDETKDTKEEAVKEIIVGRLRQVGLWVDKHNTIYNDPNKIKGEDVVGWQPLYIFTSPARVKWINDWFELEGDYDQINLKIKSPGEFYHVESINKCVIISSTYFNQHNLPPGYIESRLESWKGDQAMIDRLIYGSPVSKTGGEWFTSFSREQHVMPCTYDPSLPLHITLDFNVNPYMTLLVSQLHESDDPKYDYIDRTLREYCLKNPKNNTEDICTDFLYDYIEAETGLFYYGDPSGKNRQTVSKDLKHNYSTLEMVLRPMLHSTSDRVLHRAPTLVKSKHFCNRYMNGTLRIKFEIDPSCKNTINDFEYLKEGPNGGYNKEKTTDPDTKVSYEKLGHCADAFRYRIVKQFEQLYERLAAHR